MKSSPLTRTSEARPKTKVKPRTCKNKVCGDKFIPARPMQQACSIGCAIILSKDKARADEEAKAKAERKELKARKEAIKTRSDWMREAQAAFNAFIRERDRLAGYPCISSGLPLKWGAPGLHHHQVDAGHYRSVGSAPHLRFDERNCHAQSVQDNRYGAGCAVDYRINLIKRIGLEAVEALEADQTPRKWTIDELKAIKAEYKKKFKELKAAQTGMVEL